MSKQRTTFIDQLKIFIQAGKGGDGHIGFHRARYVPLGGPDGGSGGRGGDVILVGSTHKSTLLDFTFKKHFRAQSGRPGSRAQRTGANGEHLELAVPLGTIIWEAESQERIGEITQEGERLVVEEGGRGGLGNQHFATSTNQAPKKATKGATTEGRWIRLELRLIADIGIVGLPNAGKSTLLSSISAARPKVADYPFTTLTPMLGMVRYKEASWSMADMPGLIEGAHEGAGLGIAFLRHIQRTRSLLYVVPADPEDSEKPWNDFQATQHEIACYDRSLRERPFLVTINKTDLVDEEQKAAILNKFHSKGIVPIPISAREKIGLDELIKEIHAKR